MNNHIAVKNKAKHLQRILAVLITAALFTVTISTSSVSAYYTSGANGRSLEVIPGFTVNQLLAPPGTACREQQMLRSFTGVTIHETSNWTGNANARMHALYLWDAGRNNDVSWHYVVDSTTAYQCIPESEKSWHAGDTANGVGNASTISIEICDNASSNFDQAMANAEWLAADVLYRHGVYSVSGALFQHHDFSAFGKNCPITIRDTGRWGEFCSKTQMYLDRMAAANGSYSVTITNGDISFSGTPANASSVSRFDIYVDDYKYVGTATAVNGNFNCTMDASLFTIGWHILRIGAINSDGSVSWGNYSFVINADSRMELENPVIGSTYYGDLQVSGWAVSYAGISRVDIYVDNNQWIGSTSTLYARNDVNNAVNGAGQYKNGLYSGFSYTINADLLTEGVHVIKVAAISRDSTVQWAVKSFTIGPKSGMSLDSPQTIEYSGDIEVSGWAVSLDGISRIDIYVDDNRWIGTTADMCARSDVDTIVNSLGQYKDALHSGFSYTIDASLLTVGTHVIKVAAVSNDNTVQWAVREFKVGPASAMCLESPQSINYSDDIAVSGWAVSHAGILRVDIYVDDNEYIGSTSDKFERSDVNSIVNSNKQYKDALHSGFYYLIDTNLLTSGTHIIKVAAISRDGTAQWAVREFTIS